MSITVDKLNRALAALLEIQVKAGELPEICEHDAHVIAALAGAVEIILGEETRNAA